jgi:hypothetical protein
MIVRKCTPRPKPRARRPTLPGPAIRGLVAVLTVLLCLGTAATAGELQTAREETRKKRTNSNGEKDRRAQAYDDEEPSFLGFLFEAFCDGVCTVFWEGSLGRTSVYSETYDHYGRLRYSRFYVVPLSDAYFARYPYADGFDGFMMDECWVATRSWSSRVAFEYADNFDDLQRWSGKALTESSRGWGLDAQWSRYREDLGGGQRDWLDFGDVNALLRVYESERSQWRLGLGMNWLDDRAATNFGLNLTARADLYTRPPWVVSGEYDIGTIGSAVTHHGSLSLGLLVRRFELYGGYDYRRIGSASLHGPVFGVRIWF